MSKGSNARPLSVSQDKFAEAFDMIFRKQPMCGHCRKPSDKCGCCPTEDGPSDKPDYERRRFDREGV